MTMKSPGCLLSAVPSQTLESDGESPASPWEPAFHRLLPWFWGRGSLEGRCPG